MDIHLYYVILCILSTLTALSALCHEGGGCTCSSISVNCSTVNITSFPPDLPKDITELVITGANIHILKSVPNYENLITLRIAESRVRYIEVGAFKNLSTKLDHLILGGNELTALWPGTFEGLESLRLLSLDRNPIHVIQNNTLKGATTPKLEFLKLSHCKIYDIEANAFRELIYLKELLLDNNKLHSVPKIGKIIGDVEALETLNLNNNIITQIIGDPFTQLQHLRKLSLSYNQIHYIAKVAFVGLTQLQKLDLRGNSLRTITTDTFEKLSSLIDLDLSYNHFRSLTRESVPASVESLHLHHNAWTCDCKISWMTTDASVNNTNAELAEFICNEPAALKDRHILSLTKKELCEHGHGPVKLSVILGVVLCILAGAAILYIACMVYRKRQRKLRQQHSMPYSQVNRETELFSV